MLSRYLRNPIQDIQSVYPCQDQDPGSQEQERNDNPDPYRQTMSVRKNRSSKFLNNPLATFSVLLCLTIHKYLTQITKPAFKCHDSDMADQTRSGDAGPWRRLKDDDRPHRRRLRFKGAQVFDDGYSAPGSGSDSHPFLKLLESALDSAAAFWNMLLLPQALDHTAMCVPCFFWPKDEPRESMLNRITSDLLATLAGLKRRITGRAKVQPYSLIQLSDEQVPQDLIDQRMQAFLSTPPCCLERHWAKPVFEELTALDDFDEKNQPILESCENSGQKLAACEF